MPTTTTHFDCFFDEQEARAYVQESGNAHPCEDGLLALSGDGNVVKETRFQARDYLNAGSVDGVLATIDTIGQIGRFADRCPELRDYTIDVVLPGSAGEMQIAPNTDVLYVGAKLDPQFFDAQLCNARALTCYSKTTALRGFVHSGDLTAAGHFVHTIKVTASPEPGVYVVSAVGYNHNPIHRYQKVNPFVILVDHQRRVLKVFYFSMEKSLIGESMLIAPLRFRLCADRTLRWFAPRVCDVDGRVNTGDYTAAFQARVAAATREFDRDWNAAVAEASAPIPLPTTPAAPSSTPSLAAATFGGRRIVLVQDGVDGRALVPKDGTLLHFGTTLALADAPPQVKPRPEVLLPIAAGVAHGHSSLALGTPANLGGACTSREAYHAWLEAADALVLHADNSSAWTEPVMQAVCARLNGFLVVHVAESLPLDASARARVLGELTLCCVRMMGTASLVFVHDGAALYLYRGPTDLFPPPLCGLRFADPVPLAPHQLADIDTPKPLGRVVPFDDQRVFVDGRLEAARDVELVARVVRRAVGWETLSAQLSVALSPAEVRRVKDEAQGLILADEKAATRELQAAVQEAIDDFTARLEDAPASSELSLYMADARAKILVAKKALSSAQAEYREALGRVEQLCSLRLISKRTVGVQQATRARTIAENVGEAVSMTEEDMSRELEDNCWGLAVARVDSMQIEAFLQAISQKKIDAYLQRIGDHEELAVPPPFRIAPNCIQIDVSTAEILLMHGGNADHALASDGKQLTFTMQGEAHLVMPLFTRANDVMNGEYVNYMEECQSKPVAHYRVILRNMLSALKSRISISPQAVDLTLGIQLMPLFLMLSITRDVRDLGALQPTDTKCQILRSLFYLWGTFAGSGKKPSTFAYQLTQPGAVVVVPKQRGYAPLLRLAALSYPLRSLPRFVHALEPCAASTRSTRWWRTSIPTCACHSSFSSRMSARCWSRSFGRPTRSARAPPTASQGSTITTATRLSDGIGALSGCCRCSTATPSSKPLRKAPRTSCSRGRRACPRIPRSSSG